MSCNLYGKSVHLVSHISQGDIPQKTKVVIYRALVLTLIYSSETWTCYRRHIMKLDQLHLCCFRRLLDICLENRVTNQEVLSCAALPGIEVLFMQSQLRWSGHVVRMEDNCLSKQLFCSELVRGTRKPGRPVKCYNESLKQSMCACNIPVTG